jgi:hypothetical protein
MKKDMAGECWRGKCKKDGECEGDRGLNNDVSR